MRDILLVQVLHDCFTLLYIINIWKIHFDNLFGQPPTVTDESMPITTVNPLLNINTRSFSKDELTAAKKIISEGKLMGTMASPRGYQESGSGRHHPGIL